MKNSLAILFLGDLRGSDLLLEAVLEEEVARNARDFFSQAQNQVKSDWVGSISLSLFDSLEMNPSFLSLSNLEKQFNATLASLCAAYYIN